jgi:ATP-dependent RNA helicase DHX57
MPQLLQQLGHLGFKPAQSQSAITFLSESSPLTSNLLGSLSPLEASIEYLVLHVPECDLPERFLPNNNSSNPFITSAHSGADDLKKRWIEEKAIKEAGWPAHVVKHCMSDRRLLGNWELLITALGNKLIGEDLDAIFIPGTSAKITMDHDEVEALGAHYVNASQLVMPLFSAPIKLHILVSADESYPHLGYPPMYITSSSVPAYIRLYLLSRLLLAVRTDKFIEPGEGFCMATMRFLEEQWATIEDNGPPDMSEVLRHLILRPILSPSLDVDPVLSIPEASAGEKSRKKLGERRDNRNDKQIKDDFERIRGSDQYTQLFATRKGLPAFAVKEDFLKKLDQSRVIVVVGETGDVCYFEQGLSALIC